MDEKRIKEVFSDKAFVEGLLKLETPEEVQKAFAGKGVTVSVEEIIKLKDALVKASQKAAESGGELSMEDMEDVAGGFVLLAGLYAVCYGPVIGPMLVGSVRTGLRW